MKKILTILKYVLLAGSVASIAGLLFVETESAGESYVVGIMLTWLYCLVGFAVVVTVLLPLINIVKDPKGAVKSLIGLGIIAAVLALCYALSDSSPVINSGGGFFENTAELKLSDTGLYAAYFSLAAAMLATVVGELWNSFK